MDKLSQALLDLDNKVKLPDNNEVSRIRHGIERALKTIIDAVRENELPVNSTWNLNEIRRGWKFLTDVSTESQTSDVRQNLSVLTNLAEIRQTGKL